VRERACFLLLALALLPVLPAELEADPRWWWDDRPVLPAGGERQWPHLQGFQMSSEFEVALLLVYSEWVPDLGHPNGGDWEVWLTASPNRGCGWCAPTRITDNDADDTRPRVAAAAYELPLGGSLMPVQIVFEQEGEIVVAWDATLDPYDGFENLCALIESTGGRVRDNGWSRVLTANLTGPARTPDISAGYHENGIGVTHFHAVWEQETGAGGSEIYYARDLAGLGDAGWSAPQAVTAGGPAETSIQPVVDADVYTLALESAANVVHLVGETGEVRYLRSADSGTSWASVGAPSGTLSDGGAAAMPGIRPALSGNGLVEGMFAPVWQVAAWADARRVESEIFLDSMLLDSPILPDLPWDTDEPLFTPAGPGDAAGSISLALVPTVLNSGGRGAKGFLFWDAPRDGAREVYYRGFLLDQERATVRDFTAHPYEPVRPLDPVDSTALPLSACVVEESTFDCLPDRTAGEAGQVTAWGQRIENTFPPPENVYVAWRDTREGTGNIWFTRSDTHTYTQWERRETWCADDGTASIRAMVHAPGNCDWGFFSWPERPRNLRVYHGTQAGGPYVNADDPIEFPFDPEEIEHRVLLEGLALDTDYYVIAVPEDEARNLYPPDFDPHRNNPGRLWNEMPFRTPATCAPQIVASCALVGGRCAADQAVEANGRLDLGEYVELEITLENIGNQAATDYTAQLAASPASVLVPTDGAVTVGRIEPTDNHQRLSRLVTYRALVRIDSGPPGICNGPLDFEMVDQRSGGGFTFPSADLSNCDTMIGAGPPCGTCPDGPQIALESAAWTDLCPGDPMSGGSGDRIGDPGERLAIDLTLRNAGVEAARNFTARAAVRGGADLVSGGDIGPVFAFGRGETIVHRVVVDLNYSCGDEVALDLVDMMSDGGLYRYPDQPDAVRFRMGIDHLEVGAYTHWSFVPFTVPDGGGPVRSPESVSPPHARMVDAARVRVWSGVWQDFDDTVLTLVGPGGDTVDISELITAGYADVTPFYNTNGPGNYDLIVEDTNLDGEGPTWIGTWDMAFLDHFAQCRPCGMAGPCLYRTILDDRADASPARLYRSPRDAGDNALRDPPYRCPVTPGEIDAGAGGDGDELVLYQVNTPVRNLTLTRQAEAIRIDF